MEALQLRPALESADTQQYNMGKKITAILLYLAAAALLQHN
jgi:hypothetical protein